MTSTNGNSKEDWLIFEILCGASSSHIQTTTYQSYNTVSKRESNLCYIDINALT